MPNKKINELSPRTPSLTDLMLVGDPGTGYSYKTTLTTLSSVIGSTISIPVTSVFGRTGAVVAAEGDYNLTQLGDVVITSPTNGQVLYYNGTAWVNSSSGGGGISSINGLTAVVQTFATGTSGTDFAIVSSTSTHTFNLPTASAVNRGALSSADWSTFNAKQDALSLTTTGNSGSATLVGATLNVPTYTLAGLGGQPQLNGTGFVKISGTTISYDNSTYYLASNPSGYITLASLSASAPLSYNSGAFSISQASGSTDGYLSSTDWNTFNNKQNALTNPVTGTGTTNYLPKWTGSTALGNSLVFDNGTNVGIGTATPNTYLAGVLGASIFSSGVSVGLSIASSNTNYLLQYINGSGHYIWFAGRTAQRVGTIFSDTGNWNIGTVTIDAGYRLDVTGTFRSTLDANINGLTIGLGGGQVGGASANTVVGISALANNVSGFKNAAFGREALQSNTTNHNTAFGFRAGAGITTGNNNTAVGMEALQAAAGTSNTAVGMQSGYFTTGTNNSYFGAGAGTYVTSGTYNTIVGFQPSTFGVTTGSYNTIIGSQITGLSSSLSNTIILADGQGNQRFTINSSGDAIFKSPNNTSSIQDLVGVTTSSALYLDQATPSGTNYALASNGSQLYINAPSGNRINFRINNTDKWFITSSGNLVNDLNGDFASVPFWISTGASTNYGIIIQGAASQTQDLFQLRNSGGTTLSTFFSDGSLAIGTGVNSGYKLDVNGTTRVTGNTFVGRLGIGTSPDLSSYWLDYQGGSARFNVGGGSFTLNGGYFNIVASSSTSLGVYLSTGVLSINNGQIDGYTAGQAASIKIRGGIADGATAVGVILDNNTSLTTSGAKIASFRNATIENAFVDKDGGAYFGSSVGIGTTTPSSELEISRTASASLPVTIKLTNTAGTASMNNGAGSFNFNVSGSAWLYDWQKAGTSVMRLTGNNNLLIGTTTDAGYKLDVNGTARINGIEIGNINSFQQFRGNLAAGVYVTNAHASGPTYLSQANWTLGVLNTQIIISNNSSALQRLTLTDQAINTNNGYGYNWGLNIGADGTSVMQIFTGGNILFQKSVTKTSTNQASALVEMVSTTQGFLPPRMTSTQRGAISTPAVGLLVYQTDGTEGTYEYTSAGWRIINAAAGGGSGTVTSVSVVSANGFAGSVATATTTPAITLSTTITGILKGNGTSISAATAGTDYLTPSDVAYSVASVSTTHSETATKGTKILKADTTGGAFTITLPTAVGNTATIIIKKVAGTATLTIDGAGTETIDGGATASIVEVYESITLISDNANWQIV